MIHILKTFVFLFTLLGLGITANANTRVRELTESIPKELLLSASDSQRYVVLYRADSGLEQVTVKYAGRLHGSLSAGEYTVLPLCRGDQRVELVVQDGPKPEDSRGASLLDLSSAHATAAVIRLDAGESGPVRVSHVAVNGVPWGSLVRHTRVVSRAPTECPPVAAMSAAAPVAAPVLVAPVVQAPEQPAFEAYAPAAAQAKSSLILSAEHLFAFGSSQMDMRLADVRIRQALARAMQQSGIRNITSVVVFGHSDPVGSVQDKQDISRARAEAVADYLVGVVGMLTRNVHMEWRGDTQLLVSSCPAYPEARRNACNAPNRRVEILISGTP